MMTLPQFRAAAQELYESMPETDLPDDDAPTAALMLATLIAGLVAFGGRADAAPYLIATMESFAASHGLGLVAEDN